MYVTYKGYFHRQFGETPSHYLEPLPFGTTHIAQSKIAMVEYEFLSLKISVEGIK